MWGYFWSSMLWSVIGFVLGYLTCYILSRKKER